MDTPWLSNGDNAWLLIAATLVAIMSVPGLMSIYVGVMRYRWALNSALMPLYGFAATLLCWVVFAFKFSFGERMLPIWGKPGFALDQNYLLQQAKLPSSSFYYNNGTIKTHEETLFFPMATLVYFQFAFAAITVVVLAGSLLGRMNFTAWMVFVPLWVTFSYSIGAFSIWGGGFLYHWGVIDFAGGFVIHLSSGVAGYVAAYWVGPRLEKDRLLMNESFSMPLVAVGAGLLWLGWTGFNGGSPYTAGLDASMAVLNTHIAAATCLLVWTICDVLFYKKPTLIRAVQGLIPGLVCITPGAGVVQGWAAIVIGIIVGFVTWYTMTMFNFNQAQQFQGLMSENKLKKFLNVDDTLRVLHTHALSGLIGGILTGLLADPKLCALFLSVKGSKGAFYGSASQLGRQLVAAFFITIWNIIVTSIICYIINLKIPLRMEHDELTKDIDEVLPRPKFVGEDGKDVVALFGLNIPLQELMIAAEEPPKVQA